MSSFKYPSIQSAINALDLISERDGYYDETKNKTSYIERNLFVNIEMEFPNANNPNDEAVVIELDTLELSFTSMKNSKGRNCVELEGDDEKIFSEVTTFANIFHDLLEFIRKIQNQYKKILKPLNFKTFLVFAFLNQVDMSTINNESEIIENFKNICSYDILEKMISKYLTKITSDFFSFLNDERSSGSNKSDLFYFSSKSEYFFQSLKSLSLLRNFSIGNDIEKIQSNILEYFFISVSKDVLNSCSKEIPNFSLFKSMISQNNAFDQCLRESTTDKLIGNKKLNFSQLQMIYFYILLIQINDYYKNTFLSCCGMKNSDDINYSKSPYVFCFDCHLLVCIKCFKEHCNHHYFDFACTIKQKIGNIHSSPTKFINYSNTSSDKDKEMFVEDFIMNNIINGFSGSRFLSLVTGNKEGEFNYTIFDFLDIILLEYLYKKIYPFLDDNDDENAFLIDYIDELQKNSNFFEIIQNEIENIKYEKVEKTVLYERIVEQLQEENKEKFKNECIDKIKGTVDLDVFNKFSNINKIDLYKNYESRQEKKEIIDVKKYKMDQEYREWTKWEDLDIPIEKYQQYLLVLKNDNDKDKKNRTTFPDIKKMSASIQSTNRDIDSIDSFIENGIRDKLDISSDYIKSIKKPVSDMRRN